MKKHSEDESFLYVTNKCYLGHTFGIRECDLFMDEKYLCPYTIPENIERLLPKCYNAIDAVAEAYGIQLEEIERLTGLIRDDSWANEVK